MENNSFENKLNNKFFMVLKKIGDLIVLNLLFIVTTVLSLGLLFMPGLFSMSEVIRDIDNFINPFNYFKLLKKHFKIGLKFDLIFIVLSLASSYLIFINYQTLINNIEPLISLIGLIILVGFVICLITLFLHVIIFRVYFEDENKVIDIIKKSALIARKKIWVTITLWLCFLIVLFISYLYVFLLLIILISLMVYVNHLLAKRTYTTLKQEEEERIKNEKNSQ